MKSPKETKVSGMGTYGVSGELRVKGIPRLRPNSLTHSKVRSNIQNG